jgi:hypothetical protein
VFRVKRALAWALVIVFFFSNSQAVALARNLKLDVVQVTWAGAKPAISNKEDVANSIREGVTNSWKSMTSFNGIAQDRSLNIELGEVFSEILRLSTPMSCGNENFGFQMRNIRETVYSSLRIQDTANRSLVILVPNLGCLWSGRATIGNGKEFNGSIVLQDTASPFVITHEIGHLLGLGHSNLLRCANAMTDGPWSSNCRAVEYGGSIDVMGNVETDGPLSIYHQWRLGLTDASEVRESWVNETLELSAVNTSGALKGIFLRDRSATYWVEYRRPTASQTFAPGLVVYRSDPPPYQFVDTPLTDEAISGTPGLGVTTDMWMLNLDSFSYSQTGRANGSMTLAPSRSTTFYSGNITISVFATNDQNKVSLTINRRVDSTPPPTPILKNSKRWSSPDLEILEAGYEDQESTISEFQLKISGKGELVVKESVDTTVATYLDPFNSRKVLRVKDLPEGEYELSVRSRDVWGNLSSWSNSVKTVIDRSYPTLGEDSSALEISKNRVRIGMNSFSDKGSGLCRTALVNDDGWVIQTSQENTKPTFSMAPNSVFSGKFETFDCLGNGISGSLTLSNQVKSAVDTKRTGRWINVTTAGISGLKCQGKCTMSLSARDNLSVISGEGSPEVLITGKVLQRISSSASQNPRVAANLSLGGVNKVVRISGRDFTVYGFVQSKLVIGTLEKVTRKASIEDLSILESNQGRLAKFGFREGDFANSWVISPMDRGTTLLDPSLDLCSATYKSESGRQFRRQVTVSRAGTPYIFLSSEVVKYLDRISGEAAISELQTKFQECVKNKGGVEQGGTFVDYSFTQLPMSDVSLVPESSRVIARAQIGKGVSARQLLAFYQFKGDMFTGLYVVKSGEVGFTDQEVKRWFEVAAVMAQRLEAKF